MLEDTFMSKVARHPSSSLLLVSNPAEPSGHISYRTVTAYADHLARKSTVGYCHCLPMTLHRYKSLGSRTLAHSIHYPCIIKCIPSACIGAFCDECKVFYGVTCLSPCCALL